MKSKRLFSIVLILLSIFAITSCSDSKSKTEIPTEYNISMNDIPETWLPVASESVITLSDMDTDSMYAIYKSSNSRANSPTTGNSAKLLQTNTGSYIPIPDENNSLRFSPQDINMKNGYIKVVKLKDGNKNDMKITEGISYGIPYYNGILYEEYYKIKLKDYTDIAGDNFDSSNVVIFNMQNGSGGKSSDYGLLSSNKHYLSRNHESQGILDLSKEKNIKLFNSMLVYYSKHTMSQELALVTPTEVSFTDSESVKSTVYKVPAAKAEQGTEYILEINTNGNSSSAYYMIDDNAEPRKTDGMHRSYMIPLNEDNPLLFYVGEINEDFIFNCQLDEDLDKNNPGTIKIRPKQEGDPIPTEIVLTQEDFENREITIDIVVGSNSRQAIMFDEHKEYLSDLRVDVSFLDSQKKELEDRSGTLYTIMGHKDGFGHSRRGFSKEGLDVPENCFLEYIRLEKGSLQEGDIVRLHLHY